jgi:hypothetical protein
MAWSDAGGHAEKVEAAVLQGRLTTRAAACKCETHRRDAAKKSSMHKCYQTTMNNDMDFSAPEAKKNNFK